MASFRKRGQNWEYRIVFIDRQTGKQKEKSKGGFRTKKEAQLAAAEEEARINYFGFAENGNERVDHFFADWLEIYKKPNVKPITYSVQERNVRLNILPRWGHYRLKDLTRNEYQKWINELRGRYSEGTVRRIHSIFSTAMNDAVHEFQIMRENPIQKIKIPKQVDKSNKVAYFTREQLERFLESVKTPMKNAKYQHSIQYYALFTLLARTGLRIGEALALTWEDLDFDTKSLTVNKTLVYPLNSQPYLSTPKSKNSERTIKLDDSTIKLMRRHRINQIEVCLMYKNYKPAKDNIVFHQHDGRWLRTNVVREYFKEVCKRADLPVLSPHALRHTHAVHLLEAGANIKYVSERLGHASVKVTADTYLHVTKKIEDDALALYERYVQN
ncbi:tyrosine-type recombinase/integrase [Brevibacillus agri]|uniref:tyrosine-type recombinase/integrase n=1 Tax=Brevibacillus agri TaxID=51101 RepID=UPI002E1EDA5B|nr:tyrosine-type recombinase/integrase [Brevibacillus agri]MED1642127.1 tyrosine-type recombinase/integrase [Brevibacillus agri]MED1654458.1 tyrosine-type recombinase/integrase [Brevibacillus agri]MED1688141.1 tyrosine-type recombinase/integrase [Brevibacillus agri]MED1691129.1 tyrosine-type recombinase/integrase [Brevibacillus agri]MED1699365.1 tyrosine-type recombinase/integrase [Brevibacillus agri]